MYLNRTIVDGDSYLSQLDRLAGQPLKVQLTDRRHWTVMVDDKLGCLGPTVLKFSMTPMPGCHGIAIFHAVEVAPAFRGLGIGELSCEMRLVIARQLGYGSAICTATDDNDRENRILRRLGWTPSWRFRNPRTGNLVQVWLRPLALFGAMPLGFELPGGEL